jgi:hypothetical protein
MSHFIHIRTEIREREHLISALRDLHHQFQVSTTQTNDVLVRGYQGNQERAEIVVDTGTQYDIGFRRSAASYEVVADWWGVSQGRIKQDTFLRQLNQQYARNIVIDQLRMEDRILLGEESLPDGSIRITVSERG